MATLAVGMGDLTYLQYLIDSGANINEADSDGVTLLMLVGDADYSNKAQVAQFLLSKGANIDAADRIGRTALFFAVKSNDINLVQALSASTDKNAHEHYMVSILSFAIWNDNVAMVSLLLSWGCDVNFHDSMGGSTPLMEAAKWPNPAIRALFGLP